MRKLQACRRAVELDFCKVCRQCSATSLTSSKNISSQQDPALSGWHYC